MDPFTKIKLIYSGELLFFSLLFITLGVLKIVGVWNTSGVRGWIFNIVTLAGGTWLIVDFVWATVSKNRRQKICYLDKILGLPSALFLIPFDIYCIVERSQNTLDEKLYQIAISCFFFYLGANYLFQSIYHYFYPLRSLVDAYMEDLRKAEEEANNKENENNNENISNDQAEEGN